MARHRSPGGRAHRKGAHRSPSFPVPLRGAAVAAVTGGALSVVATGGLPAVTPSATDATAALRLAAENPAFDDGSGGFDGTVTASADRDERADGVRQVPSIVPVGTRGRDSDDDRDRGDAGDAGDADRDGSDAGDRAGRDRDDREDREDREDLESLQRGEDRAAEARKKADDERARADADKARAEADRKAREAASTPGGDCSGLRIGGLGAVKPQVRTAAEELGCRFGKPVTLGVAGRGGPSDHPGGLALDFMVNRATGDQLAQCALSNMKALGVKYVIWEQRINLGNGWKPMEDRGGVTANHFDHVHVSFNRGAGGGGLTGC